MDYELAKQLKDAGFPLESIKNDGSASMYQTRSFFTADSDRAYMIPTLSELIEACGEDMFELRRNPGKKWFAGDGESLYGTGKTPEEAVANLYLALNPSKDKD